ncbi:MAG: carbamoyl-phosphate synthase (glutamine-hydrolyzing) large subunit [Proteobacteria bacterium]|nr:carbamoyl-phosphate synthase (glutamine-hydrolyzing) large subunit [Pseudomonadota bacterium]
MPKLECLAKLNRKPKIVLLGSGGLTIGQAGEFDYSGTQAIKALIECGNEVIVINPNIATVQTNPQPDVKIYLYPVEPKWVERIFEIEKPDAIVAGFGGQTALNCLVALEDQGILAKHRVLNLGTPVETLKLTEDRDLFANKMREIGIPVPASVACETEAQAVNAADKVGYPVIVRAAYACGGLGSGFASNRDELSNLVRAALASSPQVLVEKSLKGWKEVEYEVMRDSQGNTITICNMENFDPLGIHTGDSIVVCPSQSLSDDEYQMLRNAAIKIIDTCGVVGECNVQYALSPNSLDFVVIEVNARLSRSSALASKASGYPIAYIAAKVVQGFDLLEIKNPVTGITCAYFEPALDYVTIKFPRWDLGKFRGASRELGSTMKSVGEIMAIGRSFPEAMQKAVRMVTEDDAGLAVMVRSECTHEELEQSLRSPTDSRFYAVIRALRLGWDFERIYDLTSIDKWFLSKVQEIIRTEIEIETLFSSIYQSMKPMTDQNNVNVFKDSLELLTAEKLLSWKKSGFSDQQIATHASRALNSSLSFSQTQLVSWSHLIRDRRKVLNITPKAKRIDTTAGEYPSKSNYLYMTYHAQVDDPNLKPTLDKRSALVLGCGSYRIGTSVEFDWCAVSCSEKLRKEGLRSIVINCNPETVSTDYSSSDSLYFDEMTLERVLDVVEAEKVDGVVASMGGQLPNRLARPLAKVGIKLLGHSADTVDLAEDRSKFSTLLDQLNIDQPRWIGATHQKQIDEFIESVGFPVLVRPSYVLSGAAMNVAYDRNSLNQYLSMAETASPDYPIVVSEFLLGAREIELDGVAINGEILTSIVSEHIENAGVHSGDATTVVPAQRLYVETVRRIRRAAHKIAKGLNLNGPFNIQFLARSNHIQVIECNARAARSFPFVSKVIGLNLAEAATDIMIGNIPRLARINEDDLPHVGVKAALFSFTRLAGVDPLLGVEMASTGEVGCIGADFESAYLLAMEASKIFAPKNGVLVSAGPEQEKHKFLPWAKKLHALGIPLYGTEGTHSFLKSHDIPCQVVAWPGEPGLDPVELIRTKKVDFVLNIPKNLQSTELTHGRTIRQAATRFGCSLITNMEKMIAYVQALDYHREFLSEHTPISLPQYR